MFLYFFWFKYLIVLFCSIFWFCFLAVVSIFSFDFLCHFLNNWLLRGAFLRLLCWSCTLDRFYQNKSIEDLVFLVFTFYIQIDESLYDLIHILFSNILVLIKPVVLKTRTGSNIKLTWYYYYLVSVSSECIIFVICLYNA